MSFRALVLPCLLPLFLTLLQGALHAQGTLHVEQGALPGDFAGSAVADVGDLDLDGFDDFACGARYGMVGGVPTGLARVFSGKTGELMYQFNGTAYADWFGFAVSGVGDLDADGHPDILVGAPNDNTLVSSGGATFAYSGDDGSLIYSWAHDVYASAFGYAVSDAGDVNADGFPDVFIGAWQDTPNGWHSGSAHVFSGIDGSLLYRFDGEAPVDELGYAVAGPGDLDLDGYDDLFLSILDDDNTVLDAGAARLFSGQTGAIMQTFDGDSSFDWYGYSVSGAGDVNQDGRPDLIVGAPRDDNNGAESGMARVFSGLDYSLLYQVDGFFTNEQSGYYVADAGDVNDDEHPDFMVSAAKFNFSSGKVRIFSGLDGTTLHQLSGPLYSEFGFSMSCAGDTNGNGDPDVLIGAPYDDTNGDNAGSAHVVSLTCGEITPYGVGCAGTGGLTPVIGIAGCLTPGGSYTLSITDGLPSSTAFLLFGLSQGTTPLGRRCAALVTPLLPNIIPVPLDAAGQLSFPAKVRPDGHAPVTLVIQAYVIDPAGQAGFSSTNGLEFSIE